MHKPINNYTFKNLDNIKQHNICCSNMLFFYPEEKQKIYSKDGIIPTTSSAAIRLVPQYL